MAPKHRARFTFDSSHYLNHHSNLLRIIRVPVGKKKRPVRDSG